MEEEALEQFVRGLTPEEIAYLLYLRCDKKHHLYSEHLDYQIVKDTSFPSPR